MIKVISSNIRFDNVSDGPNSWCFRKDLLSRIFTSLDVDLICTQEGRKPQLLELESLLFDFSLEVEHRNWIDERMYPCIFNNGLKVIKSGDFWLSKTPAIDGSYSFNSAFPRLCNWGEFEFKNNSFLIFNMHLDHTTEDIRLSQIKVAIEQIKKVNTNGLPLIVVGDFNTGPISEVYSLLIKELELTDPWAESKHKEESSYHMFKGFFDKGKRIDWIFISKELKCMNIKFLKDSEHGVYISDHFPVYAEIEFKKGIK